MSYQNGTVICPVCETWDYVQVIGRIVYEGVTVTYTSGVSYNPIIPGEPMTVSSFDSTTVSPLARDLMPLTMPGRPFVAFFTLYFIVPSLIWTGVIVAENPDFNHNPVVAIFAYMLNLMVGFWYGVPVGMAIFVAHVLLVAPWIPSWKKNEYHFLNESYYCHRDGVAFDDHFYATPQAFRFYSYFSRKAKGRS